jgi:hypothetical protein
MEGYFMKKGISILLVLILTMSLITPVFAGSFTTDGGSYATGGVTGDGGFIGTPTFNEILSGYIPTSASLNFLVDPLGLTGMTQGETLDVNDRTNIVEFVGGTDGNVLRAYSTSSIPVLLTVDLAVSSTTELTAVLTEGDVGATEGATEGDTYILFWMEPNVDVLNTDGDTYDWLGRVIPFGYAGDNDDVTVLYRLPEVPHEPRPVSGTAPNFVFQLFPVDGAPDYYGTGFRFGGIFNQFADWDDSGASISVLFRIEAVPTGHDIDEYLSDGGTEIFAMLDDFDAGGTPYTAPAFIDIPELVALGGGVGFVVNGNVVRTATLNRPVEAGMSWTGIPVELGTSTVDTVSFLGTTAAFPVDWIMFNQAGTQIFFNSAAGAPIEFTFTLSCGTTLTLNFIRPVA